MTFPLPRRPPNVVMIYAPRDDREVEIVTELVRAGHAFARGTLEA